MEISNLIKNVNFIHSDFENSFKDNYDINDLIYLDPPYTPINNKSFVGYVADGFNIDKHKKLFELTKTKNCKFLMSNADVSIVRETFKKSSRKIDLIIN